jgi:hypothetical protein
MADIAASSHRPSTSGWARGAATALFVYALSGAFLQVMKVTGGEGPVVPVAILATAALAAGALILLTADRRVAVAAAAIMLIALIGATPHDVENLSPANGIGQRIYGVCDMVVMAVAFLTSLTAALRWSAREVRSR